MILIPSPKGEGFKDPLSGTLNDSRTSGHGTNQSRTLGSGAFSFSNSVGDNCSASTTQGIGKTTSKARTSGDSITTTENRSETIGTSETTHKRFLATPSEIGRLFGSKDDPRALVLLSGEQPLQVQRSPYFADPYLEGLYDPHPDHTKPPTLVMRELRKHEVLTTDMRQAIIRLHRERELTQQVQQAALDAEGERQQCYADVTHKLNDTALRLSAIMTAGILALLFVLGLLGRFVLEISNGTTGTENLPLWDVVGISNFILPGMWAAILVVGTASILYGGWKLFSKWHDGFTARQKYKYHL